VFVDLTDEIHGFCVEPEKTYPLLEIKMLVFDFFDQHAEQVFHLFLQHKHLRDLGVGILTNNVFQLTPSHFFHYGQFLMGLLICFIYVIDFRALTIKSGHFILPQQKA